MTEKDFKDFILGILDIRSKSMFLCVFQNIPLVIMMIIISHTVWDFVVLYGISLWFQWGAYKWVFGDVNNILDKIEKQVRQNGIDKWE